MARLRNRIRKADYFTDGELLRWHRDKRATYTGLWAIAEDSGCLEDDPFAWKALIWASPLDADITIELLEQWRDELIDAGKLIPYEAEGKRYLYIRTFHQHEMPRNPQVNDLPLPPWVTRETSQGVAKDGKKWQRNAYRDSKYSVHSRSSLSTGSVRSPLPCPALSCVPKGTSGQGAAVPAAAALSCGELCPRCEATLTHDEVGEHCPICDWRAAS